MPGVHNLAAALRPGSASRNSAPMTPHDKKLMKNSQRLVSQTFFGTMLKQMHNSPFKSKIFSGGRGGEAFGSMLDQRIADHMAKGTAGGLVDSMIDRWEHPRNPNETPEAARQKALQAGLKKGYQPKPE